MSDTPQKPTTARARLEKIRSDQARLRIERKRTQAEAKLEPRCTSVTARREDLVLRYLHASKATSYEHGLRVTSIASGLQGELGRRLPSRHIRWILVRLKRAGLVSCVGLTKDRLYWLAPAEPKIEASPVPVELECKPAVTAEPEPKVTAEPEPKVTAEPEPKVTAEPEPKVTAEPEPKVTAPPVTEPTPKPRELDVQTWRPLAFGAPTSSRAAMARQATRHEHAFSDGRCSECGLVCMHPRLAAGACEMCGVAIGPGNCPGHTWMFGRCTRCGKSG